MPPKKNFSLAPKEADRLKNFQQRITRLREDIHEALKAPPKMTKAAREKLDQFVPDAAPIAALDPVDAPPSATNLDQLLAMCQQEAVETWHPLLEDGLEWVKFAEGSYADVFAAFIDEERLIMKIIAIRDPADEPEERQFGTSKMLTVSDVAPEVATGMALSALEVEDPKKTRGPRGFSCPSFVKVVSACVVRGSYPHELLEAFDRFMYPAGQANVDKKKKKGKAKPRNPDAINPSPREYEREDGSQLYLVQVLQDGGVELEKWLEEFNPLLSPKKIGVYNADEREVQSGSLFFQCALALAIAEEKLEFEHRDAHESNLMVKSATFQENVRFVFNGHTIRLKACGLVLTIIDYTHSRVNTEQGLFYTDMGADEDIFKASGLKGQVYKDMMARNGDNWGNFSPVSNVLWLKYLAELLFAGDHAEKLREKILELLERNDRIKLFLAEPTREYRDDHFMRFADHG
ncbi:haspin like kinase domain-containing protein [Ditylenchus destructor]|nr:haspin like kinase domain-containing protein [Ditylenchus destructor]